MRGRGRGWLVFSERRWGRDEWEVEVGRGRGEEDGIEGADD